MKCKSLLPIALLSAVVVSAISPPATSSSGRTYIAALVGDVQIKRHLWRGYQRARVSAPLWPNDKLWVRNSQSSATVICNDQNRWQVPAGRRDVAVTEGCPTTPFRPEDSLAPGRDPKNENLPYLISPRNTALFPDQPLTLRWHPVEGATYYDVAIQDLSRIIWQTRVSEPMVEYSDDRGELRRDRDYFVVITASTGVSSPENPALDPLPTIALLTDEQVDEVKQSLAQIEALNLEAEAKALAISHLYHSACVDPKALNTCLNQNAIEVLGRSIEAGTENAAIYQLQAELYQRIRLDRDARESYLNALGFAEASGNVAQQAEIQEQLGLISRNLEDFVEAVAWLRAAETNYGAVWDDTMPEAKDKLSELENLIQDSQNRLPSP